MTDHTAIQNEGLWLPNDLWSTIASFLDNEDLANFRQICKATQFVGSHAVILQPLYNRLYAIDKTLPPLLPQEGALLAFKQAFEKIRTRQQSEIIYLTEHHANAMVTPECVKVLQENIAVSLKSLEAKNRFLDEMNSEVIQARINVNSAQLNLEDAHITRLPVSLFHEEGYVNFWQNLTLLNCKNNQLTTLNAQGLAALQGLKCSHNQLTSLNVQGLVALQGLNCSNNQLTALNVQGLVTFRELLCNNNQLTTLNVQGLAALLYLNCSNNQLTALNVQGLAALENLYCDNNPLKTLILTGAHAVTKNQYAELERSLLFKELSQSDSAITRQAIIARLGANYTPANCLYYAPGYAAKLFASDSVNGAYGLTSTVLSRASAFLPSFSLGVANSSPEKPELKRKREDEMRIDDLLEESDGEPEVKRPKKK